MHRREGLQGTSGSGMHWAADWPALRPDSIDLNIVVSIYQDGGLAGGMKPVCIHNRLRSRLQLLHMLQVGQRHVMHASRVWRG